MPDPTLPSFPDDFLWGAATSAYQVEGAVAEDGRGRSVWDTFCATPGKVARGQNGDVACDHYHRYPEDVALLAELGLDAYRFSVAWPRVQPTGTGPANPAGLDFYDRLVDALLAADLTPVATLYHWDTPQPVEDAGGWLARDTAHRFADYAALVAERLADRVPWWITLNEPAVVTMLGYGVGEHAPGRTLLLDALPAAHHQLLAHGLATRALRSAGAARVGVANSHTPVWPASDHPDDVAAAAAYADLHNWIYGDPLLVGAYPDLAWLAGGLPDDAADDLPLIAQPLDFYGVNYYCPTRVRAADPGEPLPFAVAEIAERPRTHVGWPVVPEGLREILVALRARYREALPPVLVTENGCSQDDAPDERGVVDDPDRIDFLRQHLVALRQAMDDGVDVRGYFVWSLLDNFEWAEGYDQRFGLVHVDFDTLVRTPKASYHWLRAALRDEG
ncbi:GH1 family beta-glucosidase [Streptoalloteichus tenebrarius]|uniref:GH1 family beta-glucosidase n=1 Tax=Streptoalloteichus tenebrarius (strain ATCC 17920 / DSM 40477 / JCM 4838 / CBS 697.72 / NBRC 16177 / NCIMB 11028 / NRRL B-12390 / A12253. 1 / ISP 5477) TaxID=1933 RepID=UPI0020A2B4DC|nr:GH1 family beta-glucosidase [Streptoalloteichus tenebrarius]BFF01918.1 GH1 family beta-glucosidase [Streptoalloteichus tenebrarius]